MDPITLALALGLTYAASRPGGLLDKVTKDGKTPADPQGKPGGPAEVTLPPMPPFTEKQLAGFTHMKDGAQAFDDDAAEYLRRHLRSRTLELVKVRFGESTKHVYVVVPPGSGSNRVSGAKLLDTARDNRLVVMASHSTMLLATGALHPFLVLVQKNAGAARPGNPFAVLQAPAVAEDKANVRDSIIADAGATGVATSNPPPPQKANGKPKSVAKLASVADETEPPKAAAGEV